jgi:3-oxosteroid 1-dehydrogenase
MTTWDMTVDFVIVGSGGGGMVAAIAAAGLGAEVVVLEKQELIGGSTCMSGGIMWIPDNPIMRADGVDDSLEEALTHFEAVVGDVGPASSIGRRQAFLASGIEMVAYLQARGVRLVHCPGYSDYYSNLDGGHDVGRGIEPVPYDGHALGPWLERLQPGLAQSVGFAVMTNESRDLGHYNRSIRSFVISARVAIRTWLARVRRQKLLTNGASLIAQLLRIAVDDGVEVWSGAPVSDLVVEDERVVGVETVRDGSPVRIEARHGVLLAAGGFAHNPAMRATHGGEQPNEAKWSIANPGDTGEVMAMAMALGAKTDLMDEAWWLPSPRTGRFGQSTLDQARLRRRTVRQRVQLLHGGRQGDVRARQDQQGGAVLAGLRRPLPQALRAS